MKDTTGNTINYSTAKAALICILLVSISVSVCCCRNEEKCNYPISNGNSSKFKCNILLDTVFGKYGFVQYFNTSDSTFRIKFKLGNKDTILNNDWPCEIGTAYIPTFAGVHLDKDIFFTRSCGNFCSILLRFTNVNNKYFLTMEYSNFCFLDIKKNFFAYYSENLDSIILVNFKFKTEKKFWIDPKSYERKITSIRHKNNTLLIKYLDEEDP